MDFTVNRRDFLRLGAATASMHPALRGLPIQNVLRIAEAVIEAPAATPEALEDVLITLQDLFSTNAWSSHDKTADFEDDLIRLAQYPSLYDYHHDGIGSLIHSYASQTATLEFMALFSDDVLLKHYDYLADHFNEDNRFTSNVRRITPDAPLLQAIQSRDSIYSYITTTRAQLESTIMGMKNTSDAVPLSAEHLRYNTYRYGNGDLGIDANAVIDWSDPLAINFQIENTFLAEFRIPLRRYALSPSIQNAVQRFLESQYYKGALIDHYIGSLGDFLPRGAIPSVSPAEREFFKEHHREIYWRFRELSQGVTLGDRRFTLDILDHDILRTPLKRWLAFEQKHAERQLDSRSLFESPDVRFDVVDKDNHDYLLSFDGQPLTLDQADIIVGALRQSFNSVVIMQPTLFGLLITPHPALDQTQVAHDIDCLQSWYWENKTSRDKATKALTPP